MFYRQQIVMRKSGLNSQFPQNEPSINSFHVKIFDFDVDCWLWVFCTLRVLMRTFGVNSKILKSEQHVVNSLKVDVIMSEEFDLK